MSYTTCLNCGQKALSVATRCPHCGKSFGNRPAPAPTPRIRRPLGLIAILVAALAAVILGANLFHREPGSPAREASAKPEAAVPESPQTPPATLPSVTPSAPAAATAGSEADSTAPAPGTAPGNPAMRPVDSAAQAVAPLPEPPPPPPPTPPTAAPAPAAAPPPPVVAPTPTEAQVPAGSGERRYANLWVNVRQAPRPQAEVVKVLKPGEPLLVDSLKEGWYRVVADGQAIGYVYRDFVDTVPPAKP